MDTPVPKCPLTHPFLRLASLARSPASLARSPASLAAAAGAYSTAPYWAANSLVHLPLLIATHLFFVNLTYWLVGLPTDVVTLSYMFVLTLFVNLIAFFFSQFLAALCSSSQVALGIFPILFMFLSNFAGFTIQLRNVQSFWKWAPYVSFPRWAYEGLVYVTFDQKKPENYEKLLEYFSFR